MTSSKSGPTERILVVDDDMTARMLARAALERAGLEVTEAGNGRVALAAFTANPADLVLLDVMMPEMDGFETCVQIRSLPAGRFTPILMMTGLEDIDSINCAYEVGATDFTTKPVNYPALPYRVRYMLRAKHTADELRASEARLANAQRIARLGHYEWDVDSDRLECSSQMCDILGLNEEQRVDTHEDLAACVVPEERELFLDRLHTAVRERHGFAFEHQILRKDGAVRTVYQEGEFLPQAPAGGLRLTAAIQDITERRSMEKQVHQLSFFDGVTGLPNRMMMKRHLLQALHLASRHGRVVAVLTVDVDHFSRVNDTLGHNCGDRLLRQIAARLQKCMRGSDSITRPLDPSGGEGDRVAHVGGDEFIIVLTEIATPEQAALVVRRISNALQAPFVVDDTEVSIAVSIGISAYPVDGQDMETLLQQSDAAMHHAKDQGRDRYEFFTASINNRVAEKFVLESRLRKALAAGQFELHYQPKLRVSDRETVGMEALLRWQHPQRGLIAPAEFIPVAEETG